MGTSTASSVCLVGRQLGWSGLPYNVSVGRATTPPKRRADRPTGMLSSAAWKILLYTCGRCSVDSPGELFQTRSYTTCRWTFRISYHCLAWRRSSAMLCTELRSRHTVFACAAEPSGDVGVSFYMSPRQTFRSDRQGMLTMPFKAQQETSKLK